MKLTGDTFGTLTAVLPNICTPLTVAMIVALVALLFIATAQKIGRPVVL